MPANEISVRVDFGDALATATDLLVLKDAQNSYGVDRVAAQALGIETRELPGVDGHLLVPGGSAIAARQLLFLGVPPIDFFDYKSVRTFARRALSVAAEIT